MVYCLDQASRAIWLILVSAILSLPLIWCAIYGAEFINFANESLAYRFFYSIRLHAEADTTAWLPQGQLISSLQHLMTWRLPELTPQTFRSLANAFSVWTMAAILAVSVAGLSIAALAQAVTWRDRCVLSIVAIAPIYALPSALTWIWPDYIALNFALVILCVASLQYEWHSNEEQILVRSVLYGVLAGTIAANKISMVAVAFPLIGLVLAKRTTVWEFIARLMLMGSAAAAMLVFWYIAAGMFRIDWLINVMPKWFAFISNPGGDNGFNVIPYLRTGYGITVLWLAVAFVFLATGKRDLRPAAVGAAAFISALLCVVSIWKRPAGTTVGDSAAIFLALGAMLFSISCRSKLLNFAVVIGAISLLSAGVVSGQYSFVQHQIAGSKLGGVEQWDFFERVRTQADGRPIIYFVPDNYYQHNDVFLMLLKGSTDFPTWNMARTGPAILRRVGVNITFVNEYAFPAGWNGSIPAGALLVWFNSASLRPVEDHYPFLTDAKIKSGAKYEVTNLPIAEATGHVVQLP
jgi:MFS family permease